MAERRCITSTTLVTAYVLRFGEVSRRIDSLCSKASEYRSLCGNASECWYGVELQLCHNLHPWIHPVHGSNCTAATASESVNSGVRRVWRTLALPSSCAVVTVTEYPFGIESVVLPRS
jgi:hypothetical protein